MIFGAEQHIWDNRDDAAERLDAAVHYIIGIYPDDEKLLHTVNAARRLLYRYGPTKRRRDWGVYPLDAHGLYLNALAFRERIHADGEGDWRIWQDEADYWLKAYGNTIRMEGLL